MTDLLLYLNAVSPLSPEAADDFLKVFRPKTFAKGELLLREGEVCHYYYYIKSGLTKSCFYNEDKEFIMRFFSENMMFTEFSSYVSQQPSKYMIQALEPTEVLLIKRADIERLRQRHHSIEALFSKLFSGVAMGMMRRISEMLEENATFRYANFLHENRTLAQRISLRDLASYLGITQVSLSRIRASK
ncbi:MAG TPA: Crp/Fnr family transcriptional regulator [Hymenobacter sp.]|jgi:CRP-like cAMP-binding protein|uniref:Crp/Fnr family transcriptional regulator n=1 Tax=Hymenobacter sp. TaxID=1898978 RepID=UPI002ED8B8D3